MRRATDLLIVGSIIGCMIGVSDMLPFVETMAHAADRSSQPKSFRQPGRLGSFGYAAIGAKTSPSLAYIMGTVKDDKGAPLVGAVVALFEGQPRGKEIKSVKTDLKGRFITDILPGIYKLRAVADGFKPVLTRISIERPHRFQYDFALKRTDTAVQKRGDKDDYRWTAMASPRSVMNWQDGVPIEEYDVIESDLEFLEEAATETKRTIRVQHGMVQMAATSRAFSKGRGDASSYTTNFALAGNIGDDIEMVMIGQKGFGASAPQRLSAIASLRPVDNIHLTASFGYGRMILQQFSENNLLVSNDLTDLNEFNDRKIEQISTSVLASTQVAGPLLVIYGFDYSRFIKNTGGQNDSLLPRIALQYSPISKTKVNAALTPATSFNDGELESFNSEDIQTYFQNNTKDIAFSGNRPVQDKSRRFEVGLERAMRNGQSVIEASAFYDVISGHGVGILEFPLDNSPATDEALQQIAHNVTAMNGAARGIRFMYKHTLNSHISASIGYSYGRGSYINNLALMRVADPISDVAPGDIFKGGYFQVGTAKVDVDFPKRTGTHISTVIRFSPDAVVFAVDPFAGRMSVFDPNINIYVTQDLPNFGLPLRWQALVDLRNLLNENIGTDDGSGKVLLARTHRIVRGGLAFRW